MKEQLNLIQELEADICQSFEYGGIPVHLTRTQLRKILAALKFADSKFSAPTRHKYKRLLKEEWTNLIKDL